MRFPGQARSDQGGDAVTILYKTHGELKSRFRGPMNWDFGETEN
jgi:hypothetical protein